MDDAVTVTGLVVDRGGRPVLKGLSTAVLLTVGAATSTSSFPAEYLPGWLAPLADVLPPGVAVQALRGAAYLSDHAVGRGVVVLALWSAVPFLVVGALDAISRRRSA